MHSRHHTGKGSEIVSTSGLTLCCLFAAAEMQLLLHDLCWHVLEDRLKVEQAVSALAEVTVSLGRAHPVTAAVAALGSVRRRWRGKQCPECHCLV